MRKAWLIARREITWELFGDRGSVIRTSLFALLPIFFAFSARSGGGGPRLEGALLGLALQSAFIPALTGVGLIASTFTAEKENQTLVPLLAAPIRDFDIVAGKLLGMLIPVTATCAASLGVYYVMCGWLYGWPRIARVLPPEIIYSLIVVSFLYLLTAGSVALIVAARVRTSRAAQQLAGLVIGVSILVTAFLGAGAVALFDGWGLVVLGVVLVAVDVVALEIARRAWQRSEVIARI